jgi:hypothetical protein
MRLSVPLLTSCLRGKKSIDYCIKHPAKTIPLICNHPQNLYICYSSHNSHSCCTPIGFYTALFAGKSYEQAYNMAMAHIGLQNFPPGGRPVFYKNGTKYQVS